ncbi:hypothetical protein Stsp02_74610, partial [Streptomyces sp. NBRC 14336]
AYGAERSVAAAGDTAGARRCRARSGRCGRGGGARHGYAPRRPHRGTGAARHLRPGPRTAPVLGLVEVEHRAYAGRRGCGRCDQDGHGDAAWCASAHAVRGPAVVARGLVGGGHRPADGGRRMD